MSEQETNLKGCEGCRGCEVFRGCSPSNYCALEPYYINQQGNKIICPCSICLIKMICKKSCSNIQVYFRSYHSRGDKDK